MFQHRPRSTAPRTRSLALGGALAALAVVGGGTVVAVSAPSEVAAGDILLAQNATGQDATAQEMELGVPVNLDLEPVVAQAAGGTIPAGTTIQVTGLPDGLAQDGWVISGTPTRAGDYDVLVTVSNGAVSQSEKLTVTVVDASGAAAAATTTTATESGDESGVDGAVDDGAVDDGAVDDEGAATDPAATTTTAQAAPTLSAVPGAPAADAVVPDGTDEDPTGSELDPTGDDGETGTSPDLCAVLGDGEMDGASLTSLLPALTGDDDSASSGLILMLLNAVVGMLPSVLGETGSMQDLGSAGQILCTISPALLGGEPAAGVDTETGGAAALGSAPAELLGMFTTGAGSLGD